MCGIIGFSFEDKKLLTQALRTLHHRGPDKLGGYTDKHVSLGHARLRVIDLSAAADQPMTDDEGNVLIFNGEVYNFEDLRNELEAAGKRFKTSSDTEVLLRAVATWGTKALTKFNGEWAFALYDNTTQKLLLSRDRYGIKPLYYAIHKDTKTGVRQLVFSSSISAIRLVHAQLGIEPKLSDVGLRDYFTLRHTQDQTLFAGIKKLPPGHNLLFDCSDGTFSTEKWYTLPTPHFLKPSVAQEKLRELLADSVRLRMIADVPVGFYLSGGIDSGLITMLAAQRKTEMGEDPGTINTYSVGFAHANELSQAKEMADHLGTTHSEVLVEDKHIELIPKILEHTGEPVADAAFIPSWVIGEHASRDVVCVQAGEMADELFGGYDRYKFLMYGKHLSQLTALTPKISKHPVYVRLANMRGKPEWEQHLQGTILFQQDDVDGPKQDLAKYKKYFKGKSILQRAGLFDLQTSVANDFFVKADAMSMAHSLEERVPFTDPRIVELGLSVPDNAKINVWKEKALLREAFPRLPKGTRERKKRGYETPIDKWFGPKGALRDQLFAHFDAKRHSLYNLDKASKLLSSFKPTGNYVYNWYAAQKLFALLNFEEWYAQNFKK